MIDLSAYEACTLCPRQCRVDRVKGERGICGETAGCRIASACAHFGEEPAISATDGSGTIFFTGCSCACVFCQNWQISREGAGSDVTPQVLLERARDLIAEGVHNLNFVTPEHFWPHIRALCLALRDEGVTVPFIWNSSGYSCPERVAEYAEVIDIFMPDFKFSDPALAKACMGDEEYPRFALESICRMAECAGSLRPWDDERVEPARQGVLVRHLVLPGQVENSIGVLRCLREHVGTDLALSVMSQFHPTPACRDSGMLTRRVRAAEYAEVCDAVEELGFTKCFIQPGRGDPAFLPDFSDDEPFEGNRRR